jgi:hypothetical protein
VADAVIEAKKTVPRFQAERTFAWFQKKYRRLVVR